MTWRIAYHISNPLATFHSIPNTTRRSIVWMHALEMVELGAADLLQLLRVEGLNRIQDVVVVVASD